MDHQRFCQTLPTQYLDWGHPTVRPRNPEFARLLGAVPGMTTPNVTQFLNHAVAGLGDGEDYCEVGCFRGATLCGALAGHPTRVGIAVDNFSQFDPHGQNRAALADNLRRLGLTAQVLFLDRDFADALLDLRRSGRRVGVYFYDGAHDYRSQLLGLLLVLPLLADHALLVVDDTNDPAPRQATLDFLAARPEARLALDLPTPGNCHPSFWNGLMALT